MLYRRDGVAILLLGLVMAGFLLARPVTLVTGRAFEEERVVEHRLTCGEVVPILLSGRYAEEVPGPNTAADCTRAARTRAAVIVLILLSTVGLGLVGIRNGPYRGPASIEELRPIPGPPPPMGPAERLAEFLRSLRRDG